MGNNYVNLLGANNPLNGEYGYEGGINPLYASPVTKEFIIGRNGVAGCDFNFTAPANNTQQNLNLGPIIFANCVITQIAIICTEAVVGVADFNISVGNVSAGQQFIPVTSCAALNTIVQLAAIPGLDWSTVNNVWLGGYPTSNTWAAMAEGKWRISVIYNDFSKL
jgi:hypothetical protein